MSIKRKIFETLVLEGKTQTVAQLASRLKTTPNVVRARISDIRAHGYAINTSVVTNSKGKSKTFYSYA